MCKHNKNIGLLIIRLGMGAMFLMAGIMKLTAITPDMIAQIGGAAHSVGLTFLSQTARFWIASVAEVVAGVLLVIGFFVPVASFLIIVIMAVAFAAMGYDMQMGMPLLMFAVTALGLGFTGPGKWSLKGLCCKSCCGAACSLDKKPEMKM